MEKPWPGGEKRLDEWAALRFLKKALRRQGVPEKITIDGSAANEAAIKSYNAEHGTAIAIRKRKYLNNIVLRIAWTSGLLGLISAL